MPEKISQQTKLVLAQVLFLSMGFLFYLLFYSVLQVCLHHPHLHHPARGLGHLPHRGPPLLLDIHPTPLLLRLLRLCPCRASALLCNPAGGFGVFLPHPSAFGQAVGALGFLHTVRKHPAHSGLDYSLPAVRLLSDDIDRYQIQSVYLLPILNPCATSPRYSALPP